MANTKYADPANSGTPENPGPADVFYTDDDGDGIDDIRGTAIPNTARELVNENGIWKETGMTASGDVIQPRSGGVADETATPTTAPVGDFDPEAANEESQREIDAENGVNGSYAPGQYNPGAAVKVLTDARTQGKAPSTDTLSKLGIGATSEFARGELDQLGYQFSPGINVKELTEAAAKSQYGYDASPIQANAVYSDAVAIASLKNITVQDALQDLIRSGKGQGKDGSGPGSGPRAFTNVTKTINLTDPGEAERVLNSALASYMGRRADDDEIQEFVKQLNRNERFNPTVTTAKGVAATSGTTQTQNQEGGFDSTNFAERWARGRKGAGEYQAATTYMDAFTKVINELEY